MSEKQYLSPVLGEICCFLWADVTYLSGMLFEQSSRSNSMFSEGKHDSFMEEKQVMLLILASNVFLEMYLTASRELKIPKIPTSL